MPEGIYDVQNGQCWEIKQKNAYLYEKAGKYYLHSGNENFQLDSEAVDLMEKSGFEFQKGEKDQYETAGTLFGSNPYWLFCGK